MAEGPDQMLQSQHANQEHERLMIKLKKEDDIIDHYDDNNDKDDDDDFYSNTSSSSSIDDNTSTSSLDDDASSPTSTLPPSSSSSTSSNSKINGPLFQLSDLMSHLPIKRGLSKYYQGKSQSFTSLSIVTGIEDLPKKEIPYRRKMKSSKSYGNGLDASYKPYTLPKPIISKKVSRSCLSNFSSFPSRRSNSFLNNTRPPLAPTLRKF